MRRKWLVVLAILIIPFLILLLDHVILKEDVSLNETYDSSQEWSYIVEHSHEYPTDLLKLALRNKETIPFVYHYPTCKDKNLSMNLSQDLNSEGIPLLLQWDERWGYKKYGDQFLAINGCGPTCLSMIASYLKQDATLNPYYLSKLAYQKGYYEEQGTSWQFMEEGARLLGLQVEELPLDETSIQAALTLNQPIICNVSQGIFTSEGHFIVLRDYQDGLYYVNDPNSLEKSQTGYQFDDFSSQIRKIWTYHL